MYNMEISQHCLFGVYFPGTAETTFNPNDSSFQAVISRFSDNVSISRLSHMDTLKVGLFILVALRGRSANMTHLKRPDR